ncbi:hypothetical protein [Streptomyces sp. NPDC047014]|uniref:LppU/SCO3897 family protein n=1 Tax=Streptomyces sp. NPDC047014 TaxID=3155736 RepID=UPI0033CB5757
MASPPPPAQGPYPHPGPHPGPYGAPQAAQQPYGAYGAHPRPGRYGCALCGGWPAAPVTVRGHQGLIVLMRFLSTPGPFCRDCGLATYRRMSSDTLWQGWWSPLSLVAAPVTLLMNLGPRAAFRRLAPPSGGFRPPLDPGKPLWCRAPALLVLVPLSLLSLLVPVLLVMGLLAGDEDPGPLRSGECVRNEGDWSDQRLVVTDCGSRRAQYRVSRPSEGTGGSCAPGDYLARAEYGPDGTLTCLTPLR